ncbi:hypothetical protein VIGAN_01366600, partial [Vigna angularis var. angularis]
GNLQFRLLFRYQRIPFSLSQLLLINNVKTLTHRFICVFFKINHLLVWKILVITLLIGWLQSESSSHCLQFLYYNMYFIMFP